MPIADGEVAKVVCRMSDKNGQSIENVYFYLNSTGSTMSNAIFLTDIEAEMSALYATIQSYIPNSCDPVEIVCDVVEFSSGVLVHKEPIGSIAWTTWSGGTASGEGLPQGCAAVVNFPTSSPGVVGRKFLGPLTETAQKDGNLESVVLTALAAFVTEFLNGATIDVATWFPVLMSSKYASAVGMIGGVIKEVVGYQRRRKAGVGA